MRARFRGFLAELLVRGAGPHALAHQTYALRGLFDFLTRGGLMDRNPARLIPNRRLPKRLPHFLNEGEAACLIEAASTSRDRALLEFLYATGCRVGEVTRVRIEHLNWRSRSVCVLGKGQKERIVFFGSKAARALREYLVSRQHGPLFRNQRRRPLSIRKIAEIVRETGRRANVGRVHPHMLRHSFATAMLNRGANLRAIQDLLGHASISTTQKYTHLAIADLIRVHEQFHPRGENNAGN